MYSVVVAYRVGVICKSCRWRIEIEDAYIRGAPAREMAAAFYQPAGENFADVVNVAWQETLTCVNPNCGKTHDYGGDDLLLYDG